MKNKKYTVKQQGMTLVIAMIMLLVITGVGVSAVKLSSTETMASANNMLNMLVYQGAESTLIKIATFDDLYDIEKASSGTVRTVNATDLPDEPILDGKGTLASNANVTVLDGELCPVANNFINSEGVFSCVTFQKTANTSTFSATATHIEGVATLAAKNAN
ncbi:MAG TPA: hypothetical protein EYG71_04635 [Leucothrix sp.]|nr:hypothetical protein [Leucothrix sp.]